MGWPAVWLIVLVMRRGRLTAGHPAWTRVCVLGRAICLYRGGAGTGVPAVGHRQMAMYGSKTHSYLPAEVGVTR